MPSQPTYPGVYVEEIPRGNHSITAVGTSVTAFVGRALRGPVEEPIVITNFGDFEHQFGGLWEKSTMSYAVRNYYLNGGETAIIVRLANDATTATISLNTNSGSQEILTLEASSSGNWGSKLKASINYNTKNNDDINLFNLKVYEDIQNGQTESFLNVTCKEDDPCYLPHVLKHNSRLVRVRGPMPSERPAETSTLSSPPSGPTIFVDTPASASSSNDGDELGTINYLGFEQLKTGIYALKKADLFNLLCIPPPTRDSDTDNEVYQKALKLCVEKRAILIVDPPFSWGSSVTTAVSKAISGLDNLGLTGSVEGNAALYFPRVLMADPERDNQTETFVPCGIIAGIVAKTDRNRGVWKAPAGVNSALIGIRGLQVTLTDKDMGKLNTHGINCLRSHRGAGHIVWGARTLRGVDQLTDEFKYIPVRRMTLFIEESLFRGTQWVIFEPNDELLWAQIRLSADAFMQTLFRQGAFQGATPKDAYFVKCDSETTTQTDINRGLLNIFVGFAPLKPAEFVVIKIQQLSGNTEL